MKNRYVALIPAAGSGSRFGGDMPKQYRLLLGVPLIRHTLAALLGDRRIDMIVVVLAPDDEYWTDACLPDEGDDRIRIVRDGGTTRADSVINGINWLRRNLHVKDKDWVLVHDAARPCLLSSQVSNLVSSLSDEPVGGLLAIPLADTLKRADEEGLVVATIDRKQLWQAQTPQMFRVGHLHAALSDPDLSGITDEASAIERLGHHPRLVPGSLTNLKVTYTEDLDLAEMILAAQQRQNRSNS